MRPPLWLLAVGGRQPQTAMRWPHQSLPRVRLESAWVTLETPHPGSISLEDRKSRRTRVIRKEGAAKLGKRQVERAERAWLQLPGAPTLPKPQIQQELSVFQRKIYEKHVF